MATALLASLASAAASASTTSTLMLLTLEDALISMRKNLPQLSTECMELSMKPTPTRRSSHLTRTIKEVVTTKEAPEIRDLLDMVMTEAVIASKQINAIRDSRMIAEETRDNRMTVEEISISVTREIAAIQRILVTLAILATPVILAIPVTQETLVTRGKETDRVTDHHSSNVINVINVTNVTSVISVINVTKDKATKDREIDMARNRATDKSTRDRVIDNSQDRKMIDRESPHIPCQLQRN